MHALGGHPPLDYLVPGNIRHCWSRSPWPTGHLDNKEIVFDSILERDIVKGWWNGSAITVPLETVTEITFFEAPKVDYSIIGNDIKTGIMGLTRRNDGKKFVMHDAFMPSECNCSYITYTYRNPFTGETLQANAAIDGLQKIIFEDGVRWFTKQIQS